MRTFDQARFVEAAIESVLAQRTDVPIELVIADDCSTDGTTDIVARYHRRYPDVVKPMLRDRHVGGRQNFVDAQRACTGEFVAWLDGDDRWVSPSKLQRQVDELVAHPGWVLCSHAVRVVDDEGPGVPVVRPERRPPLVSDLGDLVRGNFVYSSSAVFRNGLLDDELEWILESGVRPGDWAVFLLLARHGDIGFIDEVFSEYRVHGSAGWSTRPRRERTAAADDLLAKIGPRLGHEWTDAVRRARTVNRWRSRIPDGITAALRSARRAGRRR